MRTAVKPTPLDARTITPAEVQDWFGRRSPTEAACAEIAALLTKMRWASDDPLPTLRDGMRWAWPRDQAEPVQVPDIDPDPYWDFQAATDAAKTLLASFPRMLRHWDGLSWAPETSGGYTAIEATEDALLAALPYIEWPFGKYERQDHRKKMHLADWHMPALVIKNIVSEALMKCGRSSAPRFSRDAAATRVVHNALARMGYRVSRRKGEESETNTIAAFLRRWEKHWEKDRSQGNDALRVT
jgi:hypothetical protein